LAGIYIHIPFCKQACHYCNFHFATSLLYKNELVEALLKELEIQKNYLGNEPVDTIYIGGGTPSLCSGEELQKMVQTIHQLFDVSDDAEITIETNPDDITEAALISWKTLGINRLSIGIQSFFNEDLRWMNRAHHAAQAAAALQLATSYFKNISIDLIYGFPLLSNEKWEENVKQVIASGIPHVSSYALTVEPKTPLDKMIRAHRVENVDPDKQSEQFLLLMQWMEEAGYEHYEISNFSKPGWKSRHNSSYWPSEGSAQGKKYLGIGPSAHSFDIVSRQWNVSNNQLYISSIKKNELPFEKEILTETQKLNEYIMTSLRTMEGTDLRITGNELLEKSRKYLESGHMILVDQSLVLTREGKLLADGIAVDLFF
jgi:oxygen-independent coproporphyrinogen-3 oxidase